MKNKERFLNHFYYFLGKEAIQSLGEYAQKAGDAAYETHQYIQNGLNIGSVVQQGVLKDHSCSVGTKGARWNFFVVVEKGPHAGEELGVTLLTKRVIEGIEPAEMLKNVCGLSFKLSLKDEKTYHAMHPTLGRVFVKRVGGLWKKEKAQQKSGD
jgi:hypothetical protein